MKTVLYFYENAFSMWRCRLSGIIAVAREEGWYVSPIDVGELERGVGPVLKYWKPIGVIVEGGVVRYKGCSADAFADQMAIYYANTAVADKPYFGIRHNSVGIVKAAIRELLNSGFGAYGYVHHRTKADWSLEREAIFRQEMAACGRQGRVFKSWRRPKDEDNEAFGRRLEAFIADMPKPCGILAVNDEMAVHVLQAADNMGISVPRDMVVMGIDNDELVCENTIPTLSSISPDFEQSGKLAARLLARRLRNPEMKPVVLEFDSTRLVRRSSTRKVERADIRAVRALDFVRANACKGITAADVIREMCLKARTAEKRFREVAKRSIREEIIAVRIERAQDLLRTPGVSVDAIYPQCGYGDPRSLRAAFTREVGCSLSQWRSRNRT